MKSLLPKHILKFYTKESELNVIFFKMLGTAGIAISLIGAIQSLITAGDIIGCMINLIAAIASVILMVFVDRTGKYVVGYLITSFGIFMALFGMLFLQMGGLYGSMPYFFSFGILFTLLMYQGWLLYVMELIHVVFYVGICYFSYIHPEHVKMFDTPGAQFSDQIAGIILSSLGIGTIFLMYLREYRKQQKLAQESSNAKSILLANISHEIRTPINMLLGMNEMILREADNSQIIEYSRNVETAGRQLLFMINQFLDLSRIDMGKEEVFEENFDLKELIDTLKVYYKKEADVKGLDFVLDTDRELPRYLLGDSRKLNQILMNLLSNAIKYTKEGVIVFSIQRKEESKDQIRLRFEVSDTGLGIKGEDQKKIFGSFERSDIVRNRGIEGTGLGLAISGNLAKLMGSEIKLKSKYGEGSVFWFEIDLKKGTDIGIAATVNETFIAPDAKVLAVDDNSMNLTVLKSLLKRTLIKLSTAQSAQESYELCEKNDYDLIFMDYMMPDIDGLEAMQELRKMDRIREKNVPIIVLTADATPEKRKTFLESGFDDYLLKPIDISLMENVLMKHLPRHLVTVVDQQDQLEVPEEVLDNFKKTLREYDISFEMAMKHLSGDINQFVRIASFFINSADGNMAHVKDLLEDREYEQAALIIHSLKGNSGNVGAEDLYYNARRLEKRVKDGDVAYVDAASELFFMEWKRAKEGLRVFLKAFEQIRPSLRAVEEEPKVKRDKGVLTGQLLEAVSNGNQAPALKLIDELEELYGESEKI
ncbi:MAG: response regulator, partial [Lachnospiraceae bacterium]|nr:response regulator [Lachnospiraceae bacterium]